MTQSRGIRMCRPLILVLVAVLCVPAGCRNRPEKEEREAWGPSEWKEALRDNEQRLKSEDERKQQLALAGLRAANDAFKDQIVRIYNYITGNTPFNAAKNMLDPAFPDRRRQAVMYLSKRDYGRRDPYVAYYARLARGDDDHTVRAMAIRALNRARAKQHTAIYIQSLEDRNELVRLESAKALANIPEPLAVQALMKHLANPEESIDVRIACADALRSYRTSESAQALVQVLRDRQFGVSWQARKSLKLMTGKDYRYDQAAWLTYLSGSGNPFG